MSLSVRSAPRFVSSVSPMFQDRPDLTMICVGFTDAQFHRLSKSAPGFCLPVQDWSVTPEQLDLGDGAIVYIQNCLDGVGAAPRPNPEYVTIAVVDVEFMDYGELFAAGYAEYLTYPFTKTEVDRRLTTIQMELAESAAPPISRKDRILQEACRILAGDQDFDGGADDLARRLATNRNSLNRLFKDRFGVGPMTWRRNERLDHAAWLLAFCDLSVLEVALTVGYENPANFSTAFKRRHKVNPQAFKNLRRSVAWEPQADRPASDATGFVYVARNAASSAVRLDR